MSRNRKTSKNKRSVDQTGTTRNSSTASTSHKIPEHEIMEALKRAAVPCTKKILAQHLKLEGKLAVASLELALKALTKSGHLVKTRANRYGIAAKMDISTGIVLAHPDGYAFVRPDEGGEDVYVNRKDAQRVLHLDRVQISVQGTDQRGRKKGHIVEILERANHEIIGRYFKKNGVKFVVPDNRKINQDILLPNDKTKVSNGEIVVVEIEKQPDGHSQPLGKITEVLGEHMAPGMEIDIAIRSHQLPHDWPPEVDKEIETVPSAVGADEIKQRRDLRDSPFVTIDGEDARDFDDAVYCKETTSGFTLYVAIADVSHYVSLGAPLDAEAYERGTSVYFPNYVVPMLPEVLSNGICSLKPKVDRLALVCELSFDPQGNRKKAKFYDAVIHSHARLTYTTVSNWLTAEDSAADDPIFEKLKPLVDLYHILDEQRRERGALEVETVEPVFTFNEDRKIETVEPRSRNDAHKIIEECMIAANVAAAEVLSNDEYPAIYRNHDRPDSEKLEGLKQFLVDLGLPAKFSEPPTPESVAEVLKMARDRPDREMVETMILRSLKLAMYSADNQGHFGLALESYCHFTSPIRRYPDLVVHRALKNRQARRPTDPVAPHDLVEVADRCSFTERRAEEASRDVIAWLKCEFMRDKIGEEFAGYVSGVTSFGIFVTLADIFIEGLVHVTALPQDYYHFDEIRHVLSGERSGRKFRISDQVSVKVLSVSLAERKIDFELCK